MQSNYDKQARSARELFLGYDQQAIIRRYGLAHDEKYLYLTFLGEDCRVSRQTGAVELGAPEGWTPCDSYNVVMTVYDALCYPKETPRLAGEWCPLYSLQVTMSSPSADFFLQKYAATFAGHPDRLERACRALGGTDLPVAAGADVCCKIDLFPFFPVQFRFWDADDEFPAKIQLMWDRNSLAFMHFETLYYVIDPLLGRLKALYQRNP